MFEQAFKNIDDVLRKEAGCTTELDYTEQTSWLLADLGEPAEVGKVFAGFQRYLYEAEAGV